MLKFIRHTTWDEVFADWKAKEGSDPAWIDLAREKGWSSWEAWRKHFADMVKAKKRSWDIFEVTDPRESIPKFIVGPFKSWQQRIPKEKQNTLAFSEFIDITENVEFFSKHSRVILFQESFLPETMFIGLIRPDEKVVLLEGHHRAAAITLAQKQGIEMKIGKVFIALAKLNSDEDALMDAVLAQRIKE